MVVSFRSSIVFCISLVFAWGSLGVAADEGGPGSDFLKQEAMVQDLVGEHLPELEVMLDRLRTHQPQQYKAAVSELFRAAKRLENGKNRDAELFPIEIELLKSQTQAKLLAARLKVRDCPEIRQELRDASDRLVHAQIQRAQYDVRFMKQRIAKAQLQLDAAEKSLSSKTTHHAADIESTYAGFLRRAGLPPNFKPSPD